MKMHKKNNNKEHSLRKEIFDDKDNIIPSRKEIVSKGKEKYVLLDGNEVSLEDLIANENSNENENIPSPLEPPIPNNNNNNNNNNRSSSLSPRPSVSTKEKNLTSSSISARAKNIKNSTKLSEKMIEKRKKIKEKEKIKRKKRGKINNWKIDYSKLDSKGDPSISFDVNSKRRGELFALLDVKIKGRGVVKQKVLIRKITIEKLGKEFARIYKRYRNLIQTARGRESKFVMPPEHEKYCEKIALQCIYQGITPRQLLEYWDEHIKNFAKSSFKMQYPPLSFLSGVYASEQVAAALFSTTNGGTRKWKSGDFRKDKNDTNSNNSHSFFDVEELDIKLKKGLIKAGFDIGGKYNDRYLLTVQKTAMAISDGKKMFVGGELKKMVDWAIDNLYGGLTDYE